MVIVIPAMVGLLIGAAIDIVWLSADALLGTSTITETKALGVLGLCAAGAPVLVLAIIIREELRT